MDVNVHKALAESLKELTAADKMLLTCNQDSMWDVVDGLRRALQLVDGHDTEIMCMIHTKMAETYLKFEEKPGSKEKAKSHLNKVMAMAGILGQGKRNLYEMDWFSNTSALLQNMRDDAQKKEDEEWANRRHKFMLELNEELKMLEEHIKDDNQAFVNFLFEKMPPTHRPDVQLEPLRDEANEKGWKKPLMKLLTTYHPDKLNNTDKKYRVLCEEICKELGRRYSKIKLSMV
jgi:hypothetical protein